MGQDNYANFPVTSQNPMIRSSRSFPPGKQEFFRDLPRKGHFSKPIIRRPYPAESVFPTLELSHPNGCFSVSCQTVHPRNANEKVKDYFSSFFKKIILFFKLGIFLHCSTQQHRLFFLANLVRFSHFCYSVFRKV